MSNNQNGILHHMLEPQYKNLKTWNYTFHTRPQTLI